jgi:hypothetical protein
MFGHIIDDLLHRDIYIILNYSLINVSNHALNYSELLEKFPSSVQDLLRENVFFSVYPQVWETLLCGVKYFSEIA